MSTKMQRSPEPSSSPAAAAHQETMGKIHAMLARLQAEVEGRLTPNDETLHWGHVGDAQRIAAELQHVCDVLFREGEYAPEN